MERAKKFSLLLIFIILIHCPEKAGATISNSTAYTHLGQTDEWGNPDPTKGGISNLSNRSMLNPGNIALDTMNHRLYANDYYLHRIIFYNLNNDNSLADNLIDGVIGQVDLYHGYYSNRGGGPASNSLYFGGIWNIKGLLVDSGGNLWVSDDNNHRIIRFPAPIKGDGTDITDKVIGQADFNSKSANRGGSVAANSINQPAGLAFDSQDNLWVSDFGNHRLIRFPSPIQGDGTDTADKVIGQPDFLSNSQNRGGSVAANSLYYPRGIKIKDNNLYVADANYRVIRFPAPIIGDGNDNADWVVGQVNLTSAVAGISNRNVQSVTNFIFDNNNNLLITDLTNHRVLHFSNPLGDGTDIADAVIGQSSFNDPCPTSALPLRKTNYCAGDGVLRPNGLSFANDLLLNPDNSYLLIADSNNGRIVRYSYPLSGDGTGMSANYALGMTSNGQNTFLDDQGWAGTGPRSLYSVRRVSIDYANHKLYTVHLHTNRIMVFDLDDNNHLLDNVADGVVGQDNLYHQRLNRNTDLLTTDAGKLFEPLGVTVDNGGNLWVADTRNYRILRFPAPIKGDGTDMADKVVGAPDFVTGWARNRPLGNNNVAWCENIALDSDSNLWVADAGNHRVTRFPAPIKGDGTDVADKVIGQADFNSNSANRGGSVAVNSLNYPSGLFFDEENNLWIADVSNSRILRFPAPIKGDGTDVTDKVIGQTDFTSGSGNRGQSNPQANSLASPRSLSKIGDYYFVADQGNNRILRFALPIQGDGSDTANLVVGQDDFNSKQANKGSLYPDATSLSQPFGVVFNGLDQIFVPEYTNHRLSVFNLFPINNSIRINDNNPLTSSQRVILSLSSVEVAEMRISSQEDFFGAVWEPYSTTKEWNLEPGLGNQTIYAQFRDSNGGASPVVSDTIGLTMAELPQTGVNFQK